MRLATGSSPFDSFRGQEFPIPRDRHHSIFVGWQLRQGVLVTAAGRIRRSLVGLDTSLFRVGGKVLIAA